MKINNEVKSNKNKTNLLYEFELGEESIYNWNTNEEFELPIVELENHKFLYWVNQKNEIVSRDTIGDILTEETKYKLIPVYKEDEFYTLTYKIKQETINVKWYKGCEVPKLLTYSSEDNVLFHYFYKTFIVNDDNLLTFFENDKLTIETVFFNDLVDHIVDYADKQIVEWSVQNINNEVMFFLVEKTRKVFNSNFNEEQINDIYFDLVSFIVKNIKEYLISEHYNNTLEYIMLLTEQDFIDLHLYKDLWLKEKVETIDLFKQQLQNYLEENYYNYFLVVYSDLIYWITQNITIKQLKEISVQLIIELKNYPIDVSASMMQNTISLFIEEYKEESIKLLTVISDVKDYYDTDLFCILLITLCEQIIELKEEKVIIVIEYLVLNLERDIINLLKEPLMGIIVDLKKEQQIEIINILGNNSNHIA